MLRRNNQIHIYLDDKELKRFKDKVAKSGLTQNAYVRHLIGGSMPQDRPPPEYTLPLKEIRAIGRNINQIALVANATGIIDAQRFDERHAELAAVHRTPAPSYGSSPQGFLAKQNSPHAETVC
jgi:hypothetical protein